MSNSSLYECLVHMSQTFGYRERMGNREDLLAGARKVIVEQTAAVSQMASAAQELLNLSLELQSVVSRFRLDR